MPSTGSHIKGYALAAAVGAIGGGLFVALATKAIPNMMSQMMRNVMTRMEQDGFNPAEIWQQMMAGFGEAQEKEVCCE